MNEKEYKQRASRLEDIGKTLGNLPPEIRAAAFELLKDYITEHPAATGGKIPTKKPATEADVATGTKEEFFASFNHDKPHDNVRLITAYFYREYGTAPFTMDDIRTIANEVGITVPERPDMTIKAAIEKGKKLYTTTGWGKYKPTVHGEVNLKQMYQVKKGTKPRPETLNDTR